MRQEKREKEREHREETSLQDSFSLSSRYQVATPLSDMETPVQLLMLVSFL